MELTMRRCEKESRILRRGRRKEHAAAGRQPCPLVIPLAEPICLTWSGGGSNRTTAIA
jgi:hypothetical protein